MTPFIAYLLEMVIYYFTNPWFWAFVILTFACLTLLDEYLPEQE